MAPFTPKRWDVFLVTLPQQEMETKGEGGRPFRTTTSEMWGDHRIAILKSDDDGRFVIGVPMTSARNAGGEKWAVWKPTWHRAHHQKDIVCIQTEQIRYVDRARLLKHEGTLGVYDQQELDKKVKALLSF